MVFDVLVTGLGRHPGQLAARSPWLQPVHLDGPEALIGTIQTVRIARAHPNSLGALRVEAEEAGGKARIAQKTHQEIAAA